VEIIFSRHAKRRARLYKIPLSLIKNIIAGENLRNGKQDIIKDVAGFNYSLKIIVSVKKDLATVITNYPIKKGFKNESLL